MNKMNNEPELFDQWNITGMVQSRPHETSVGAAHGVNKCKTKLHSEVLEAFRVNGPMTDNQLQGIASIQRLWAYYSAQTQD